MFSGVRRGRRTINVWPGYVDALAALLMVVIFVLLIFTLAQFILRQIVSTQEDELLAMNELLGAITEELGLERKRSASLSGEIERLSGAVAALSEDKQVLSLQVEALSAQSRDDRARIDRQLLSLASLQQDIDALRKVRAELEARVGQLAEALGAAQTEGAQLRDRSLALEARLAEQEERTHLAQKDLEAREIRIQALSAVVGEQRSALEEERKLSADAQAEITLLSQKISELQSQLQEINQALAAAEHDKQKQAAQIADLGERLNIELARKVNELERYRSDFFGRLREALGENPGVRVEGDRFVFQSELLFGSGSAELGSQGQQQLSKLAQTLQTLARRIPPEVDWILRVDGHTDLLPINTERFPSNWELSTARAVSVVRFLAEQGIPEQRMAATGFGEFRPLDRAATPQAFGKNRRIELKLTSP